ncbi:tRNA threonylcarbamoyladenosine dehydratase [Treponema sp.]|uniref:tRNA threonylcarbamoyladenosine dehydratase n=1 Tax=Treponema sp. TaxID=166 RepID=UPI0025F1EA93|nr:tRNA threonylcarbamoyladenosine dehydratase [Treponema sp.]MCR5217882.1 tRNA threonylcarbamoyladenosine dehydratase [Treponema sp.]
MLDQFSRTRLIFGDDSLKKLQSCRVIVFGVGGVGSYTVEALVRSGIGAIDLVDNDEYSLTNLNRQLYALHSTIGRSKVEVAAERIKDINPDCRVEVHKTFFTPETSSLFDFSLYDYVVDCIDTVSGKVELVVKAQAAGVPVISSMGAGNKVDPLQFKVADIYKTSVCPLARAMRNQLKARRVKHLKCVYSTESALKIKVEEDSEMKGRGVAPGSNAFVPSVCGLIIAGEVIKDLTHFEAI